MNPELLLIAGAIHDIQEKCKDEVAKRQLLEALVWMEKILKTKYFI